MEHPWYGLLMIGLGFIIVVFSVAAMKQRSSNGIVSGIVIACGVVIMICAFLSM